MQLRELIWQRGRVILRRRLHSGSWHAPVLLHQIVYMRYPAVPMLRV